jgi:flavorubredoxin
MPPLDLAAGKLIRLGGVTPIDAQSGWVPDGTVGAEPFNVYLLREGPSGLLIDTGPKALTPILLSQLDVCWDGAQLDVVLLRNELEAIGGVGPVIARIPGARLLFPGGGGVLDWIDYYQRIDGVEHDLRFEAALVLGHPESVELGRARSVRYVPPPMSNLTITWLYDEATGAMFTTDAFAFLHTSAEDPMLVCRELPESATAAYIAAHLAERFFWLRKSDVRPVKESIIATFARHPTTMVCPSRGVVVCGSETVAQIVERTLEAIDLIPRYAW